MLTLKSILTRAWYVTRKKYLNTWHLGPSPSPLSPPSAGSEINWRIYGRSASAISAHDLHIRVTPLDSSVIRTGFNADQDMAPAFYVNADPDSYPVS